MKKLISNIYIQKNPIFIGVVTVAATLLFGMAIAFATGINMPTPAHAQLAPPCCTLPPPPPPIIIPIIPPVPVLIPAPTCTLSASATTLTYGGGNSVLSWSTSHASSVSINHGIGSVSATSGSRQIHVSTTGTYTLSVSGAGGTATCGAKITVAPPPAPTCTLSSSPSSIQTGSSSKLTYITTNATSFTINHNVGTLTPVSGGSKSVSPTVTTTYTGTAHGAGGTATCGTSVTVTTPPPPHYNAPTCTLSASPKNIHTGSSSVLSWTTKNATSVTLNHTIGTVNLSGSKSVSPTTDITYTLTAHGAGTTVTCGTKVTVTATPPPPHYNAPTCTLSSSPSSIQTGSSSKLTYTTSNATSFIVNHNVGTLTPTSGGSKTVSPITSTTYTGTVTGAGGTATCGTKVTVTVPPPPPTPAPLTITATKIVCQKESDLPDWSGTHHAITKTTATDYVVAHPDCHLASGWTFEWANGGASNPGNEKLKGGSEWTPFGPTTSAGATTVTIHKIIGGQVWIREEFRQGYIPFTGVGHNISTVSAELYCHTDVLNYDNYDAVKNPQAGKAYYCVAWNVLKKAVPPPHYNAPTCTLSASPTNINTGSSSKLTYITTNATSFTINHNVGTLTPVSGGSKSVSPTVTTTYTGTAHGAGGTVTCGAKVTVTTTPPPPPPPTTTCTLSAAPSSIPQGGSSILSWKTTYASSFTIDNGIGKIINIASGATTTAPTDTVIYTGTAKGAYGTAVCKATVIVTHGGGGSSMCVLIVSPSTIPSGATAKLSWGGRGIKNIFIDNGVGTTTSTSGFSSVSPSVGTHKYTGTFTTSGGQKLKCSSTLTVTGGGGPLPPMVTLTSFRKPPPSNPLALVYLSQIPYTGLDLGTVGTILYWLILIAWSGAVAYILLFVIVPLLKRRAQTFGTQVRTVINSQEVQQSKPQPSLHVEAPTQSYDAVEERSPYSSYNGFRSFAQSGALSVEDIVHGLSRNGQEHMKSDTTVEPVAIQPVAPDTSISSITSNTPSTHTMIRSKDTQEEIPVKLPPAKEKQSALVENADTVSIASTRGFLASLLEGDRTAVFYALRQVARGGGDVARFLTDATCMLDDAFRARVEGTDCDSDVARLVAKYQTPVLEEIITALATAIDASYSSDITAAKLALTHALVRIGA